MSECRHERPDGSHKQVSITQCQPYVGYDCNECGQVVTPFDEKPMVVRPAEVVERAIEHLRNYRKLYGIDFDATTYDIDVTIAALRGTEVT